MMCLKKAGFNILTYTDAGLLGTDIRPQRSSQKYAGSPESITSGTIRLAATKEVIDEDPGY